MNSHIIIGTAGHVDHGKTCLIRALTGTDTDRLEEEKRRGITIDLGFTYLPLPDGTQAGIIDVPGHEKFVHNMLSGAGGIDLALLVVAADEGVMPQTREHLGILSLLGIRRGCVAVTKVDMVEADWLVMMLEELKEELQGSFLEGAPIVPVSSHTGAGIDQLRRQLVDLVRETPAKNTDKPFRLPVDRVFTMPGFGTVITGTLIEGTLLEGQDVLVYPQELPTKVRNLQVHTQSVAQAYAGQRVAVNLQRIKMEEITRGSVLAEPGSLQTSYMVDVALRILPEAGRSIRTNSRLHFHHGSGEVLCKAVLLGGMEELLPGQNGYAQLRFEEPVAAKAGDPFVLRFYSPLETVGGGMVLDPKPYKHKASSPQALEKLRLMYDGSDADRIEALLIEHSPHYVEAAAFSLQSGLPMEKTRQILLSLRDAGRAIEITDQLYLHHAHMNALGEKLERLLQAYHAEHPLKAGIRSEELRARLLRGLDAATAERVLDIFVGRGTVHTANGNFALPGFQVTFTPKQQDTLNALAAQYNEAGFSPPEKKALLTQYARDKDMPKVLDYLIDAGQLIPVDGELFFPRERVQEAQGLFERIQAEKGAVTLADFRDGINASRKYALAILEYWDLRGHTKKSDDARTLAKPFDPLP
ncbi:MAG: selenocysteine-specific translation elongation factor [Clostridiales bacterium]|nr:selenocysteine-specific translation elongation factor [Clostridiales bacterium]